MPSHRYVQFHSDETGITTQAQLTGPTVVVQHHHEGWQQVQRLMRMSFPEWQGSAGYELQIPIIFDSFHNNSSKEADIRKLEKLSEPDPRFDPLRPPILRIQSWGDIPHDRYNSPNKLWIIAGSGIAWGDYISTSSGGYYKRVRQAATVSVWEWFAEQIVVTSLHNRLYKIKRGDTLQKIALRYYGDKNKWRAIAKKNKIRDPNHPRVGRTIKLP